MLIDRLLHVPNAQPPEPTDYEPRPTHPVVHVPYQVAAAWDQRVRAEVEAKKAAAVRRKQAQTRTQGDVHVAGRVPLVNHSQHPIAPSYVVVGVVLVATRIALTPC